MNVADHIVYVVDDDLRSRESIENLLSSYGLRVALFASAAQYVDSAKPDLPACLILDVELPDINGLDLQRELSGVPHPPIVFITGYGDIPGSVRAMKAGAVDFLSKPFEPGTLLEAVNCALAHDRDARAIRSGLCELQSRYASLTPRERDVFPLIVQGMLNKQAAAHLGISIVTVQIHRGRIMHKMSAASLAELVRMSTKLGVDAESPVDQDAGMSGITSQRNG
ncbi:MAG: response regulator [Rhodanobacteraceae bacterium]